MMNQTCHHPDIETLTAFSAGSLPISQSLCVAVHLEHCADCRSKIMSLDSLGGELLEALKPVGTNASLREHVFNRISASDGVSECSTGRAESSSHVAGSVPRCLRQFISEGYDSLKWTRISPSIRSTELSLSSAGEKVELLRIKPGGSTATHTHLGEELTVILEGSFSDEDGLYRAGDFLLRNENHKHTPVATQDGECICLAVTQAPIQFTGFFTRWLNPLLRKRYRVAYS